MTIKFTAKAREKIQGFMEGAGNADDLGIRIQITGQGPQGFTYEFFLDEKRNAKPTDILAHHDGLTAILDAASAPHMDGATVDWKETVEGSGFDVDNPNPVPPPPEVKEPDLSSPVARRVQEIIQTKINPGVASHGGYVELIDVQQDKAYVKLGGGCQGCGMVNVTLKQGIEVMIKESVPEISQIIDTTDHAGGTNPYFQPSK